MPNVTVYIRKEDWNKWEAVKNKPLLIHDALAFPETMAAIDFKNDADPPSEYLRVQLDDTRQQPAFVPKPPDPELGYPCCQGKKPCKHWEFDGADGLWRNGLTGKTRETN